MDPEKGISYPVDWTKYSSQIIPILGEVGEDFLVLRILSEKVNIIK